MQPTAAPVPSQVIIPPPTYTPQPAASKIPSASLTPTPTPRISRVLIVTFDGLRPDAIAAAEMTNVLDLMKNGAFTLNGRTILPSSTLPSHASMLTGACPAKHIVRWNEYVPENGYARGTDIFDLAHQAGLRTVMVVGKEKLRQLTEPSSTDFFAFVDETDKIDDFTSIQRLAVEQVREGFNLMLLHFPDGDLTGHDEGWMSREQLAAYKQNDQEFGVVLDALKDLGMYEDTVIIVTADHGGHDSGHGSDAVEDVTIPWIVSGPRVDTGILTTDVHTTDTAATAAFVLGLTLPAEWDGVPVFEAFGLPVPPFREIGC